MRALLIAALVAGVSVVASVGHAQATGSKPEVTVGGITVPSKKARPWLGQVGVVSEVKVKNGDRVKKGQLLIAEDSRREQNKLKALELEATSTARIDAAVADLIAIVGSLDAVMGDVDR